MKNLKFSILKIQIFFLIPLFSFSSQNSTPPPIDGDKLGAWYMYFFNTTFKQSQWGIQGDIQYRNWNLIGDLEQLLLRGGVTFKPKKTDVKFTLGYGNITTGGYGIDNYSKKYESRIYQEVLYPVKFGKRFYTNHRFRFEQRFVENQSFRTRYRYNLFINIPINKDSMKKNTIYLALYNELFINGQRDIGSGSVELFDRNRLYVALGYVLKKGLKIQMGIMNQSTDNWSKNQFQFSLHHKI